MDIEDEEYPAEIWDEVIDTRFWVITAELHALEDYIRLTETHLPVIIEHEREYALKHADWSDEEDPQSLMSSVDAFVDEALPRIYRYPMLVALWAIYESGTIKIAKELQRLGRHRLSIEDLHGGNKLLRVRKYFDCVLEFDLVSKAEDSKQIEILQEVRNAIAHANGRLADMKQKSSNRNGAWKHPGISTDGQYLSFSAGFIEDMFKVVNNSLLDLIARAEKVEPKEPQW